MSKQNKHAMIMLLVFGAILASIILWLLSITVFGTYILYSFSTLLIFIAITCYPLALVYGKGDIEKLYESIRVGSYRPFRVKKSYATIVNWLIAVVITLFFGWAYGTYGAYRELKYRKPLRRVK